MPRHFRIPPPRAVETIFKPEHLRESFADARVRIAVPAALPAACHQLNVGLTSWMSRGDNQAEQLRAVHATLVDIAGGDFRYLGGLRRFLGQNAEVLDTFWSPRAATPQTIDPVILALRDAALSLPQLRLMMDAPGDDTPAAEMISFLARVAAASFEAGIEKYRWERQQEGRRRSTLFGQEVIGVYVDLTRQTARFSRGAETSRRPGKPSGEILRFLRCFFAALPARVPAAMVAVMPDEMLRPSSETLADWIQGFRQPSRWNRHHTGRRTEPTSPKTSRLPS
jgi:hypothetical protein